MPLDAKMLNNMPPGTIFATGVANEPGLAGKGERNIRWIAKKGNGNNDWALYYGWEDWSIRRIAIMGDKSFTEEIIRRLVPCDDEAYGLYRR